MERSVFSQKDYKAILRAHLEAKARGALSRAAEATKCQRSYLSRVLNSNVHLTLDQAFLLAQHLKLNAREQDYFLTLVECERASSRPYREHLQKKLGDLIRDFESLAERVNRVEPEPNLHVNSVYFANWYWSAIHFLTSISQFQSIDKIAQHLELNSSLVKNCLETLAGWNFVRKNGDRWIYNSGEFHLNKTSPFVGSHHNNWRQRAVLDAQLPSTSGIHFTNVQTLSSEHVIQIKTMALDFISRSANLMQSSPPETCVALTLDMFEI